MEWIARPDLNWCYHCWFGANIESTTNEISQRFLCKNCGVLVVVYPGEVSPEEPRYFSDLEWDEYWTKNIKEQK